MWPLLILVVIVLAIFGLYNGLVKLKVAAEGAWADIDVQLKRRYDLIPNLVETVKGYATHERGTLEAVIDARSRAMSAVGPAEKGLVIVKHIDPAEISPGELADLIRRAVLEEGLRMVVVDSINPDGTAARAALPPLFRAETISFHSAFRPAPARPPRSAGPKICSTRRPPARTGSAVQNLGVES